MEVILERKCFASELHKNLQIYPQLLKNVRVVDKQNARQDPDVKDIVEKISGILGEDGRILVRESGTEPVIRVMVEAKTDEICKMYVEQVVDMLIKKGHVK